MTWLTYRSILIALTCSMTAGGGTAQNVMITQTSSTQHATLLKDLPPYMTVLLEWGQRPEWSIDGKWIYFLPKAFSDVYRIEVATGKITPVTTHYFHEGYNRVLALANGDLLLAGPDEFDANDPWKSRHKLRLSVLEASFDKTPILLDAYCDEGPAVSRHDNRIAWTLPGQREIRTAVIVGTNGKRILAGERTMLSFDDRRLPMSHRLETQDFLPGTNKLIFTYYNGTDEEPFYYANPYFVDLATGEIEHIIDTKDMYNEAEGVAPDGSFLLIESDRHAEPRKWLVDVYMLELDSERTVERLCDWTKYPGYKCDNPVVSPDGKKIALQIGFTDGAGQGRGIVLLDLREYRRVSRKDELIPKE
jgi:hypothetical protein